MADEAKGPLTVEAALARVLLDVPILAGTETLALQDVVGRVTAAPIIARYTQPPFDASAMDGYAVRAADLSSMPATLKIIGEAAAGRGHAGALAAGHAVRIFTGAPLPAGADAIVIQENTRRDGDTVTVVAGAVDPEHIRPRGGDFSAGQSLIAAHHRLTARDLTLAAAAGHDRLNVIKRPVVAILATGDELVMPGSAPGPDQIVCSNPYGVGAMVAAAGGVARLLGIARDNRASLDTHINAAAGADILVTLGGASVGDHDLVGPVLQSRGMALAFWKIAMRPGKPMMFGSLGPQRVLGLPGNPVSSLITTRLFVVPLIRKLLGLDPEPATRRSMPLAEPLPANGARAHYMRAVTETAADGQRRVRPAAKQDSSLLTPLAAADCLIVRPIGAPPVAAGDAVDVMPLDF